MACAPSLGWKGHRVERVLTMELFLVILLLIFQLSSAQVVLVNTGDVSGCTQAVFFNDCRNKMTLRINSCETLSLDPVAYYGCQCEQYTALENCYNHCPHDPVLQLDLLSRKSQSQQVCASASSMSSSASLVSKTTTKSASSSKTASSSLSSMTTATSTTFAPRPTPSTVIVVASSAHKRYRPHFPFNFM